MCDNKIKYLYHVLELQVFRTQLSNHHVDSLFIVRICSIHFCIFLCSILKQRLSPLYVACVNMRLQSQQ